MKTKTVEVAGYILGCVGTFVFVWSLCSLYEMKKHNDELTNQMFHNHEVLNTSAKVLYMLNNKDYEQEDEEC